MSGPARWRAAARRSAVACACAALSGCAVQSPLIGEYRVNSTPLPGAAALGPQTPSFCLHLRYSNTLSPLLSHNVVQAWATDGHCAASGAERQAASVSVGWRYKWRGQSGKQCASATSCTSEETHLLLAKYFECVSASAADGDQIAHISSDQTTCP